MANILDFTDNGGAIIEIPKIDNDYSLVVNHWKSVENQLQEIEKDLLESDSPERTDFLKKYAEELQKHKPHFLECDKYDEYVEYEYDYVDEESDEEEQFYHDERNRSINFWDSRFGGECISIYNFELKHSLAWYVMDCLDNETAKIEQKIEIQKGVAKILSHIDEVMIINRKAESHFAMYKELMQRFPLSELQAKMIANLRLSSLRKNEFTGKYEFEDNIALLECQKSFLLLLRA